MRLCFSSQLIAPSKLLHVSHMAPLRRGSLWSKRWVCYVRRKHFILCTWGSSALWPAFLFQRKNSTPGGVLVNQLRWRLDCFWSHPGCRRERRAERRFQCHLRYSHSDSVLPPFLHGINTTYTQSSLSSSSSSEARLLQHRRGYETVQWRMSPAAAPRLSVMQQPDRWRPHLA